MEKKKLVFPGDHLSSGEEAESGGNTYLERDEVYASAFGEVEGVTGKVQVKTKNRTIDLPHVGMEVYGVVVKSSPNKAIVSCISAKEVEGGGRGIQIDGVLPVTEIRRAYVPDLRDEVKIGDVVKAKIREITKTGVDLTFFGPGCGIVVAFCPRCRNRMDIIEAVFVCGKCGWKERRKLAGSEEEPPRSREDRGERGGYEQRGPPGERRGPPREGRRPGPGGPRYGRREGGHPPERRERRQY